ncbi:AMP-binding protein [Nannocystis pusilla]|uniref:AMP-binding protein n=1 Tax=Nannocystis pusilla TaxID=889268 RepID=UPI003B7D2566
MLLRPAGPRPPAEAARRDRARRRRPRGADDVAAAAQVRELRGRADRGRRAGGRARLLRRRRPRAGGPALLAYVLHTSGTTGQPRGIQLEHAGVADMLAAMQHQYALRAEERVLFQTSITFDVSVQEIFWPLSVGAAVVVAPGHQLKGRARWRR